MKNISNTFLLRQIQDEYAFLLPYEGLHELI